MTTDTTPKLAPTRCAMLVRFWYRRGWRRRVATDKKPCGFYKGRAGYMSISDAVHQHGMASSGDMPPF
jgi:hypothetical protein